MPKKRTKSAGVTEQKIGARIIMRRHEVGMTQTELGNALGIAFQQIQKYEKGTNRIGGHRLGQMADALGVGVEYFYRGIEANAGASELTAAETFAASKDGAKIAAAFGSLSAEMRAAFVTLIETAAVA